MNFADWLGLVVFVAFFVAVTINGAGKAGLFRRDRRERGRKDYRGPR